MNLIETPPFWDNVVKLVLWAFRTEVSYQYPDLVIIPKIGTKRPPDFTNSLNLIKLPVEQHLFVTIR